MKKICNLTTTHTRNDQRVFLKECLTEKQNYEVHLVVCDEETDELKDGIYIHGNKGSKARLGRAVVSALRVYRRAKSINADIYVFHEYDFLWLALFLKKRSNILLWDCHEDYLSDLLDIRGFLRPFRYVLLYVFKILSHIVVKKLDGCITVCDKLKTWLLKLNCKNCYVLHNFALKRAFQSIESHNYDEAQHLLYVGSFEPLRGIHILIQALDYCRHKDIRLIIGGYRISKCYKEYCELYSVDNMSVMTASALSYSCTL